MNKVIPIRIYQVMASEKMLNAGNLYLVLMWPCLRGYIVVEEVSLLSRSHSRQRQAPLCQRKKQGRWMCHLVCATVVQDGL